MGTATGRISLALACLGLLAGCGLLGSVDVDAIRGSDEGFRPLMTGDNFNGFVTVLDSKWANDEGVISSAQNSDGRLQGESWLLTKDFHADFALRLQFRITPGGNSGVFVRVPVDWQNRLAAPLGGPSPWDAGYEVNINNDHETFPTGSIWALAPAPPRLQLESEWNDLEIILVGQRIWTWVNGKPAVQGFELPERAESGAIGFQRHGGAAYRDKLIEFREGDDPRALSTPLQSEFE